MKCLSKFKHIHWWICLRKCCLPKWWPSCPSPNVLKQFQWPNCASVWHGIVITSSAYVVRIIKIYWVCVLIYTSAALKSFMKQCTQWNDFFFSESPSQQGCANVRVIDPKLTKVWVMLPEFDKLSWTGCFVNTDWIHWIGPGELRINYLFPFF